MNYPVNDKLSLTAGPILGWDEVSSNNNGWSGMANATYTPTDKISLAENVIGGPEQTNNLAHKRVVTDTVATIKATPALTLLLNYDWGHESGAAISGDEAIWQGFAAVANYAFTDRISAAYRGEWFQDHGGSRTGFNNGNFWEQTLTAKYLITQHLYGQVEYRHDQSTNGNVFPKDSPGTVNTSTGPVPITEFTGGQDMVGFNVTYVFN